MMIPQLLALAAAIGSAQAHYIWTNLKLGSVAGGVGEGIRPNTNYNSPVTGMRPLASASLIGISTNTTAPNQI